MKPTSTGRCAANEATAANRNASATLAPAAGSHCRCPPATDGCYRIAVQPVAGAGDRCVLVVENPYRPLRVDQPPTRLSNGAWSDDTCVDYVRTGAVNQRKTEQRHMTHPRPIRDQLILVNSCRYHHPALLQQLLRRQQRAQYRRTRSPHSSDGGTLEPDRRSACRVGV